MDNLPKQLLSYFLLFLPLKDAFHFSLCCKKFLAAFENELFWKLKCELMGFLEKSEELTWKNFCKFEWHWDISHQNQKEFESKDSRTIDWHGNTHSTFGSSVVFKRGLVYNFIIRMDNINSIRVGAGHEKFN